MPRSLFKVSLCPAWGYMMVGLYGKSTHDVSKAEEKPQHCFLPFFSVNTKAGESPGQIWKLPRIWGFKPPLCHQLLQWHGVNHLAILCICSHSRKKVNNISYGFLWKKKKSVKRLGNFKSPQNIGEYKYLTSGQTQLPSTLRIYSKDFHGCKLG